MKKTKKHLKLLGLTLLISGIPVTNSMAGAWTTATSAQQAQLTRHFNTARYGIYRSAGHFKTGDLEPTRDLSHQERLYFVGKELEAYESLQRKWEIITDGEADIPPTPTHSYYPQNPFTGAFSPNALRGEEEREDARYNGHNHLLPLRGILAPSGSPSAQRKMTTQEPDEATPEKAGSGDILDYRRQRSCARRIRWADLEGDEQYPERLA